MFRVGAKKSSSTLTCANWSTLSAWIAVPLSAIAQRVSGTVEDRADLFNEIILRMKSCVREPKDNEISFANQKDASVSIDDEEDTRNWKRIKRPVNDKTKIGKFERMRYSLSLSRIRAQ